MDNSFRSDLEKLPEFKVENIKGRVKLDQNEYYSKLPRKLRHHILYLLKHKYSENKYPQPMEYYKKKEKIAEFLGIKPENIAITNGADQAILATMMITKEKVGLISPTYPIYENDAIILNKNVEKYQLKYENDFEIEKGELPVNKNLLCLISPNSPTGNKIERNIIENALKNNDLVSLDEAYIDFSNESHENLIESHDNIIIIRTFSKIGLAGWRFGYVLAPSKIITLIEKVLFAPYNITLLHFVLMDNFKEIFMLARERGIEIAKIREKTLKLLREKGFKTFKSYGNFLLFEADRSLYEKLLKNGIKTRFFHIEGKYFIRITISHSRAMDHLITILG